MPASIVITLADAYADAVIANHAWYCALHGLRHVVIDVSRQPDDLHIRCNHKFQAALHWLSACADQGLLMVLTDPAVVWSGVSLASLMEGRDVLVGADFDGRALGALTIWRNSEPGRRHLRQVIRASALGQPLATRGGEPAILVGCNPVAWNQRVADVHVVIPALHFVDPVWLRVPTFAVVVGALREADGGYGVPHLLRDAIVDAAPGGRPGGPANGGSPYPVPDTRVSVFNPGQPIALVMLYTPNIAAYGRIAETRLREYCEACGYTACVYRSLPSGMSESASGNWAKPWVLRTHLPDHDWVFWVDADILVQSFEARLEPLLAGRDRLLTWDIGGWQMNSGLMGLRNTPASFALLDRMVERTESVADKSSVYHSGGDQSLWIAACQEAGWLDEDALVDVLTLNTPWYFQQADSFMVHYFEIWNELRVMVMDTAYRRTCIEWRDASPCPTS